MTFKYEINRRARVLLLGLAAVSVLALFEDWWFVADLAAHWAPHYTAVAVLFALWFAYARDIRWTIFALALTLYHGVQLIPLRGAPEPVLAGDELRIVSFNVKRDNANPRAVVDYLLATDADVIVLIEPTGAWRGELDRLQTHYPYVARALRDDAFGLAVFSRLKDSRLSVIFPGVPTLPAIQVDGMTLRNKIPFTIYAVHAPPPLNQLLYTQRNAVFAALADLVSRAHRDRPDRGMIISGDLNASPWSGMFRRLLANSGLRDAAGDLGIANTWPSGRWISWLGLPIDHVLVSPNIGVRHYRIGRDVGSDHLPVQTTLLLGQEP